MNRHVHRRADGLLVICRRFWCAGWLDRSVLLHAGLVGGPFLLCAASKELGRSRSLIVLAVFGTATLLRAALSVDARLERHAAPARPRQRGGSLRA